MIFSLLTPSITAKETRDKKESCTYLRLGARNTQLTTTALSLQILKSTWKVVIAVEKCGRWTWRPCGTADRANKLTKSLVDWRGNSGHDCG